MKVSERSLNVWTVVRLSKAKEFTNPNWVGEIDLMRRIMNVAETEHWKMRVWKEYFYRFQ